MATFRPCVSATASYSSVTAFPGSMSYSDSMLVDRTP
jgi:hypothetical protein